MPAFGSTINPALGRTDYSVYAQGAAQGAAQIGQGIQQLGAGIGAAIKEWSDQKKQIKKDEGEIKATTGLLSALAKNTQDAKLRAIIESHEKELYSGTHEERVAKAKQVMPFIESSFKLKTQFDQKEQQDKEALAAASALGLNQAFDFGPDGAPSFGGETINNTIQLSPDEARARIAARNAALMAGKQEADIGLTKAQTFAAKSPKEKSITDLQAYVNASPEEKKLMLEFKSASAPKTELNTTPGIAQKGFEGFQSKRDSVLSLDAIANSYNEAAKAIDEGAFTGTGAEGKLALAKIGSAMGLDNWDNEINATEYMKTQLAKPVLELGQSIKGSMSDSDRVFLVDAALGKISASPKTIKRIRDISKDVAKKAKNIYLADVDRVYGKGKETHDPFALAALSFSDQNQEPAAANKHKAVDLGNGWIMNQ